MSWPRRSRYCGPVLLAAAAFLVAGLMTTSAANAAPALPAASPAVATKPASCVFGGGNPVDCRSSDPEVTKVLYSGSGDCSTTYQKININWGDKTPVQTIETNGPTPNQKLPIGSHDYAKRGTYDIRVTGNVISGPCTFTPTSYTFTLAKVTSKLTLAALGDSYSSGEGSGDYYPGTDSKTGCHRSPNAWAEQLGKYVANHDVTVPKEEYLVACSGAESPALRESFKGQQSQDEVLQHLLPRPTLVTLTMGGNDLGFSSVVKDCALAILRATNCVKDGTIAKVEAKLPGEEKTLAKDYIETHLADPSATLLIVGYPRIFEETKTCLSVTPLEETALNVLTGQVDAMIEKAAKADGFGYVPVLGAVAGHEMCTKEPWIYEIGALRAFNDDQQQAHPNALGQREIAKKVANYINDNI
jgi:lysophospholipase L1-like esterase